MSTSASEPPLTGRLFDGRSTRPSKVGLRIEDGQLCASGEQERRWPCTALHISERLGRAQRRIALPDGGFIEVADSPAWDALPQAWGKSGAHIARLESRWPWVLASLLGILASCWALYVYALPWAADRVARQVPASWTAHLSQESLALFDRLYAEPSELPEARQQALRERFAALQAPATLDKPAYTLHFRKSRIGPNAFALPSGDIVMTDELVALARNDSEIIGVLAHELGHVHERHGLRQSLRAAIVSLGTLLLLGDASDVAGLATGLLELRYSREFETEADDYAIAMLRANRIDPAHLGNMLELLHGHDSEASGPMSDEGTGPGWLSTHPAPAERIRRLKAAGALPAN